MEAFIEGWGGAAVRRRLGAEFGCIGVARLADLGCLVFTNWLLGFIGGEVFCRALLWTVKWKRSLKAGAVPPSEAVFVRNFVAPHCTTIYGSCLPATHVPILRNIF